MAAALTEARSASENAWSACAYDGERFFYNGTILCEACGPHRRRRCVFRWLDLRPFGRKRPSGALQFAAAASALKHTVPGISI